MRQLIIDAHGHCDEYTLLGWIDPPELVVDLMDKAGIDLTAITTYGEAPSYEGALEKLVGFVRKFPDRLTGFIRIDPKGREESLRIMEEAAACPEITGVKMHPVASLLKPYNPFSLDVIRRAASLDLPVFFHCGDNVGSHPWELGLAAQACPEAVIICHMGAYFHHEEALRMARACPNIYLDTSSGPYPRIIRQAVETLGPDRVVFASDSPAGDPISDLAKVRGLGFDRETEDKILYKNIARLLKLKTVRGVAI